jgi:hypothetical protein
MDENTRIFLHTSFVEDMLSKLDFILVQSPVFLELFALAVGKEFWGTWRKGAKYVRRRGVYYCRCMAVQERRSRLKVTNPRHGIHSSEE